MLIDGLLMRGAAPGAAPMLQRVVSLSGQCKRALQDQNRPPITRAALRRSPTARAHKHNMAEPVHANVPSSNGSALLSVRGVSVRFGGIVALDNVSLEVERGD